MSGPRDLRSVSVIAIVSELVVLCDDMSMIIHDLVE